MLVSNHDNQKIPLKKQQAFVINNNSNVYIANNNMIEDSEAGIATITINKGNTVNHLTNDFNNYDILYGNSTLYSSKENFIDSQHEYLIDYNFPAARININGNKSVYAILLNNQQKKPYWTPLSTGIMLDDLVTYNLNSVPTRMNGYSATVNSFGGDIISGKYNGSLVINSINKPLTTSFVYQLKLTNVINENSNQIFAFTNTNYLEVEGELSNTVLLKNVKWGLLNSNNLILQNSNISINSLNTLSNQSYNAFISYNVNSLEYKEYIATGTKHILNIPQHRNIFTLKNKYQKQTVHPVTSQDGYSSNIPIGAIVWYPEVWTAITPNSAQKRIISRGEPNTEDWALCDGREIPSSSLYTQLYGLTTTPNYVVEQRFYKDSSSNTFYVASSYHFLTEQSVLNDSVGNNFNKGILTIYPLSLGVARSLEPAYRDNEHKQNWIDLKLTKSHELQMKVKANWRCEGVVTVNFIVDCSNFNTNTQTLIDNFAIEFDSYCCSGDAWWKCWTGANISALKNANCVPSTLVNGQRYLGGLPYNDVVTNGRWTDTTNCPKLALRMIDNRLFEMKCISNNGDKLFSKAEKNRCYYNGDKSVVRNMDLLIEDDGGDDYTPCTDQAQTSKLSYELKTYRIQFKKGVNFNSRDKYTIQLQFQVGIPAMRGYFRCKDAWATGWSDKQLFTTRWANLRNRDDTQNGAPYHTRFAADYITLFNNIKMCYGDMKLNTAFNNTAEVHQQKHWSQDDWPSTTNVKNLTSSKWQSNSSDSSAYQTQKLYRRLNPYIKINDDNVAKYYPPEKEEKPKQWINPVTLVRVRLNNPVTDDVYNTLNLDNIIDNKLSSCYILSDWNAFENNIVDFNFQVQKTDLQDLYTLYEENITISSEDGTKTCTCNTYLNELDKDCMYVEFLEDSTIQDLFPTETKEIILQNGDIETETRYIGLNLQINTLKPYIDNDWIETTDNSTIQYSYFNINRFGDGYQLVANPDLINLAANYKAVQCAVKAARNTLDHGYINTSGYSLPIFKIFKKDENKELTATINDGMVNTYYFLGTYNHVFDLTSEVSGFEYYIAYNEITSGGKVGFSGQTVITQEGSNIQNILISNILSSNNFFEQGKNYYFSTSLLTSQYIEQAAANQNIYNALCGYVGKVGGVINLNISTIANLSAVEYENFLTGITPIQIGDDVKPLTGLPNT